MYDWFITEEDLRSRLDEIRRPLTRVEREAMEIVQEQQGSRGGLLRRLAGFAHLALYGFQDTAVALADAEEAPTPIWKYQADPVTVSECVEPLRRTGS